MLMRVRRLSFVLLLVTTAWATSVGAFDDWDVIEMEDEFGCGANHYALVVAAVSQNAATQHCQNITCADFCSLSSCGSNIANPSSHPTGCTDADPPSGWAFASLGKCDCTPLPR
jgi:hypothetical protein